MVVVVWIVWAVLLVVAIGGAIAGLYGTIRPHRPATVAAMLASVLAPAIGLLGTVCGLIVAFDVVATADPSTKASVLAAGISSAMHATALGIVSALVSGILGVAGWLRWHRAPFARAAAPPTA